VLFSSRTCCFLSIYLMALSLCALAEGTKTWEQSKFDDLIRGTPHGVAICSSGGLELAPSFTALYTTPSSYIWSVATDQQGNVFAAAGSPARVYRISPDGKSSVIFEPQELQVQSIAVSKSGDIYAATNPDGKVYKIHRTESAASTKASGASSSAWSASVYFDPQTKYIWNLLLDDEGNLFVATGDHGQIFRVTPRGEHSIFFQSDEPHIRVLALDPKNNLIAGTDGSGLIYRISPKGDAFVLYSAPKKEITALAIDKQGNIYAAGVGEKRGGSPNSLTAPQTPPSPGASASAPSGSSTSSTPSTSTTPPVSFSSPTTGSEIYRIASDGSPTRMWNSHDDLVYALSFDAKGTLLAGTGNRGHIFAINGKDDYTDLLIASANQVTAFASAPDGSLYASSSNLGKVFTLGAHPAAEGSYDSDVFDAHIFSRWGRAYYRSAGKVELYARSGNVDNPDRNWSAWEKVDAQKQGQLVIPPARFVQWRAVLLSGGIAPRLESVTLNYLSKNVAPEIDDISVQPATRYLPIPKLSDAGAPGGHIDVPPTTTHDRDSIGVKWSAHDDNDDQMVYSVYYRGDGEQRWLLLKDDLSDKFYSFDASLLPDDGYTIKIVASDAPSHSPGEALSAEKESARFEVDTTPPRIDDLAATSKGSKLHVTFRATDGFSVIKRAEYSVDAGPWQFVEPVGEISDAKTESYDFRIVPSSDPSDTPTPVVKNNDSSAPEHVVVVRVYDRYDNMVSAKTIVRGGQ